MPDIRLDVMDVLVWRVVGDWTPFAIGRRRGNDVRLAGSDEQITEKFTEAPRRHAPRARRRRRDRDGFPD